MGSRSLPETPAMGQDGTVEYRSERPRVLSMVLAGGEGKRLAPLTLDRAKPAVPFGGHYRLIDFALAEVDAARLRHGDVAGVQVLGAPGPE
jgi:hypothetical protein